MNNPTPTTWYRIAALGSLSGAVILWLSGRRGWAGFAFLLASACAQKSRERADGELLRRLLGKENVP